MTGVRVVAAAVLTIGLLAGCSVGSTPSGAGTGAATQDGYTSTDGTTTTWAVGHRTGPLQVTGTDFDGQAQDTASWLGDVVVVNTWYAGCPPCRAEAADLAAVARDFAERGVHVLGINSVDDAGSAQAFQRSFEVPYPSVQDTGGTAVAALQGVIPVNATPTTVVLDREGRVYARILGAVDAGTLRALVQDALAGPTPGPTP
ncbi:MAG: TlpA family protein disulfide reductase [Actinobacteria bacterium]|nr:TlpA family protein disulfide reductase [Actinomycetota bacterium]MCG2800774.1 TlpA family protein disulfide reductase [Cellulomonas sp.]